MNRYTYAQNQVCVCTDENATCAARNPLKTLDTVLIPRVCFISTTTLYSVRSRTGPDQVLCLRQMLQIVTINVHV